MPFQINTLFIANHALIIEMEVFPQNKLQYTNK